MTTTSSVLRDAFAYHTWATLELLDALHALDEGQLIAKIPGTYGTTLETLTHLVNADDRYLRRIREGQLPPFKDEGAQSIPELRPRIQEHAGRWEQTLDALEAGSLHAVLHARDDYPDVDHSETLLMLQALHHGNDHRTQVCSTLGALGLEVPDIDVWSYWKRERV